MVLFAATGVTINARYRTMPKFKSGKTTRLTHSPVTDPAKKLLKSDNAYQLQLKTSRGPFYGTASQ